MRFRILIVLAGLALQAVPAIIAQEAGSCTTGTAEAYLDVNNVRARLLNNGGLYWRGSPNVYEVPRGSGVSALFTVGIRVAGIRENRLRMAASTFGPYEFWPGPLDEDGSLPRRQPDVAGQVIFRWGIRPG